MVYRHGLFLYSSMVYYLRYWAKGIHKNSRHTKQLAMVGAFMKKHLQILRVATLQLLHLLYCTYSSSIDSIISAHCVRPTHGEGRVDVDF